jgi:hypothetical protein
MMTHIIDKDRKTLLDPLSSHRVHQMVAHQSTLSQECCIKGLLQYQCHFQKMDDHQNVSLCKPFIRFFRL